jgi:hypothetical protein
VKPDIKIGWLVVAGCLATNCAFAIAAHSEPAAPPSLVDRLILAQSSLASRKEEVVDARELAESIASVPKVTREWAALILTVAAHESNLRARIAANDCREKECDGGRAFGLYQAHKNEHNAAVWGSSDVRVQTLEAARGLRSGFYVCNHGKLPIDWVARTINGYAGRRCDAVWPGLEQRLATFNRVLRKL